MAFPHLFSPARVGGKLVANRLVMAPVLTGFAGIDGEVNDTLIDYYLERAQGGVGIIIVEAACIDQPEGLETFHQLRIDHPKHISSLERLSRTITNQGARAFIQIFHAGRQTSEFITGMQPVAPSPLPCPMIREMPRELSTLEVEEITARFVKGAYHAAAAGFDGVEIHAAHGYLINQFLSPHSNHRRDKFGGNLENRMRLLLDVVRGIKSAAPELLVSIRINIDDFVAEGLKPEESLIICEQLEICGADLIHCSVGTYESGLTSIEPASYPEAWRMYLAQKVKEVVGIPVIGGGMIRNPETAEQVIKDGQADFVFLGRGLLADPYWPVKAQYGKVEDIRPCISCNHCFSSNSKGLAVSCTVNPWLGNEANQRPNPPKRNRKERVVIVGAGPAGMQAAIALSGYGFEVSLYEKDDSLGGLLNLAALPPYKQNLAKLRDYLIRQVVKGDVQFNLEQAYDLNNLSADPPDHLIIATGSKPILPGIEGWDKSFCHQIDEVLRGEVKLEKQRVLIIGGGSNGCEVADYLLAANNKVTIVEKGPFLAPTLEKKNRRDLMNRLKGGKVNQMTSTNIINLSPGQAAISNQDQIEALEVDAVISAVGFTPVNQLFINARQLHNSTYLIGDAYQVKGIKQAVDQGEMLARRLLNRVPC